MRTLRRIPVACALLVLGLQQAAASPAPPNLVVIMTDDLDRLSLDTLLRAGLMPNLQQSVLDGGVRFDQAFVTDAICCPSRITYLTGQYAQNHQVFTNNIFTNGGIPAFDDAQTLPVWLRQAGYTTSFIGKYLNGYGYFFTYRDDPAALEEAREQWDAVDPSAPRGASGLRLSRRTVRAAPPVA